MNHAKGPLKVNPNTTAIDTFLPNVVMIPLLLKENFLSLVLPVIMKK